MILYGRSLKWGPALGLALAGLIGVGTALMLAAPARTAASAFELILETTWHVDQDSGIWSEERFRSGAPFCTAGTFEHLDGVPGGTGIKAEATRFACDDGTGSLTIAVRTTTWQILGGTGSYADLRGSGPVRTGATPLALVGFAAPDATPPTVAFSSARGTKLPRPARAYSVRVELAIRDDIADNPVSYTLRAYAGRVELARRVGTATTGALSLRLRIRRPAGTRTVRLGLTALDPVGNGVSVSRALRLPR